MTLTVEKKLSILKATNAINGISKKIQDRRRKQSQYLQKSFSAARRRNEKQRRAAENSIVAALTPFFNKQITSVADDLRALSDATEKRGTVSIFAEKHGSHDQLTHGRGRSAGSVAAFSKSAAEVEKTSNAAYLNESADSMNAWMKTDAGEKTKEGVFASAAAAGAPDVGKLADFPEFETSHGRWVFASKPANKNQGWVASKSMQRETAIDIANRVGDKLSDSDAEEFTNSRGRKMGLKTPTDAIDTVIESWNSDSNSIMGMSLQVVAEKKYGIEGARPINAERANKWMELGSNRKVIEAATEGIYENTQAHLKENGVESLVVYRGIPRREQSAKKGYGKSTVDAVSQNRLSSYTTSVSQAEIFSGGTGDETHGDIIGGVVKAKDIFSVGRSGIGTLVEAEVVVMHNSSRKMKARTFKHDREYDLDVGFDGGYVVQRQHEFSSSFWSDE